jgi:hypothetical protein
MKIKLVGFWDHNNYTQITLLEYRSIISQAFDFEFYDPRKAYDRTSTLFVCNHYQYYKNQPDLDQLIKNGYRVVFESLQEKQSSSPHTQSNVLHMVASKSATPPPNTLEVPLYFWYHENRMNTYEIQRTYQPDKKFLLMMNFARPFRDDIYNRFAPILEQGLCSYVERGILLDGDTEHNSTSIKDYHDRWDRYINPNWYNRTEINVVVETQMSTDQIFVTEKTMKPLALQQPFIMLGSIGTLNFLQQSGFETYDNLFDETYDFKFNRLDLVYEQIQDYEMQGYDQETRRRMEHNANLFHNRAAVEASFTQSIIDPLLEFING